MALVSFIIAVAAAVLGAAAVLIALGARRRAGRIGERLRRTAWRADRAEAELLRVRKRVFESEIRRALAAAGREPALPVMFRSQFGEDVFLWELFEGRMAGVYVEAGAFDGWTLSVSAVFEAVGWTGLLVEPMPGAFEACRERRIGSRVVRAALSRRGSRGTARFQVMEGEEFAEMCSRLEGGRIEAAHGAAVRNVARGSRTIEVPLSTMDDVLAESGLPGEGRRIDFVVLDVEGGELDLLDGFDLERHRPRVLVIEDVSMREGGPLGERMERAGYVGVGWVGVSRVFVHGGEAALVERGRGLTAALPWGNRAPESPA